VESVLIEVLDSLYPLHVPIDRLESWHSVTLSLAYIIYDYDTLTEIQRCVNAKAEEDIAIDEYLLLCWVKRV
jgi:hypothetical protein